MSQTSGMSYERASRKAKLQPRYIEQLVTKRKGCRFDTFARITVAFGFELHVTSATCDSIVCPSRSFRVQKREDIYELASDGLYRFVKQHSAVSATEISRAVGRKDDWFERASQGYSLPTTSVALDLLAAAHMKAYVLGFNTKLWLDNESMSDENEQSVCAEATVPADLELDEHFSKTTVLKGEDAEFWKNISDSIEDKNFLEKYHELLSQTQRGEAAHLDDGSCDGQLVCKTASHQIATEDAQQWEKQKSYSAIDSLQGGEPLSHASQRAGTGTRVIPVDEQMETDGNDYAPDTSPPSSPKTTDPVSPELESTLDENVSTKERQRLIEYGKRLQDLTMRNPLLNYRSRKTGTLSIITPDLATCYESLVLSERDVSLHASSLGEAPTKRIANVLFADRTDADLMRCLRRLETVARTSIEEQGINILHAAFGMLSWVDATGKSHDAPLILAPVQLSRSSMRTGYILRCDDEDPSVNPTLAYYLSQNFGIDLPDFQREDSIEEYCVWVRASVRMRTDWRVNPTVVLSTFQFQKLSMYHDIMVRGNDILTHPVVRAIMGETNTASEWDVPRDLDSLAPTSSFQVVDADESQQRAIVAAHNGHSFVLQGPPGTGKSQTITNIIADCLGSGKTVLFVSEKKAALDVVYHRLQECMLDDFCLVLHSKKAGKKEVLAQLGQTLKLYGTKPQISNSATTRLNRLVHTREQLNEYSCQVFAPISPLNVSPYEAIGIVSQYEEDGVPFAACEMDFVPAVDGIGLFEMSDAVAQCAMAAKEMGQLPANNPWVQYGIAELEYGEDIKVVNALKMLATCSSRLSILKKRVLDELAIDVPNTYEGMKTASVVLERLASTPMVPEGMLQIDADAIDRLFDKDRAIEVEVKNATESLRRCIATLAILDSELATSLDWKQLDDLEYVKRECDLLVRRLDTIPQSFSSSMALS